MVKIKQKQILREVESYDIDAQFVNTLLDADGQKLREAIQTVPVEVVQGDSRDVYEFILKYYKDSLGKLPSRIAIKRNFPDFHFEQSKDDVTYFVSEIVNREKFKILAKANTEIANLLLVRDLDGAQDKLRSANVKIANMEQIKILDAFANFQDRVHEYEKLKLNKGRIGMSCGIKFIDDTIGGLVDEMVIIMGKRAVGKTWLELFMTHNLHPQVEGTVVVVTNEISPAKMLRRVDALEGGFSYSKYRKGLLNEREYKKFIELEHKYGKRHPLLVVSGKGKSVDMIEYEVASLEPALLVVDGLYLQNQGFNDPFRDTLSASRGYQRLIGKLGIPGIFTTQANKDDETKYALAVEEDADIVMLMYQTPAYETDKIMGLKFTKVREDASNVKQYMNWDFDDWNFSHYDMDEPNPDSEEEYN